MDERKTTVVAMTNQKGGCGKTTTTVSLAAGLASLGQRVVVIDTDPQCNATDSFGLDRDDLLADGYFTIADAFLARRPLSEIVVHFRERFEERLFLAPGHRGLSSLPQRLEAELQEALTQQGASSLDADEIRQEQRLRLKQSIASLRGLVDVVLIDTPPDLGFVMTTSLVAADYYLIPVFPSGYDLKGLETLLATTEKVRARLNPDLRLLGVVLGNVDSSARLDADIREMLRSKFGGEQVFRTVISRSVKHREAPVYGRTIFEHAPGTPSASQFGELSREFLERLGGTTDTEVAAETGETKEAAANV
ncbi:MAG: ParA family protein [Bryobacteraceae bacterium]